MKLFDFALAPSPKRVRMILVEKGLDIPIEQVDLSKKAQFEEPFKSINPRCTVPALQLDSGEVLCDSQSITRYLEEVYPEPPMLGSTPLEKALVVEWITRVEQEGFMATAEAFRNSVKGMKGSAITGPVSYEQIPELAERGRARVKDFFGVLNERLAEHAFLAGENFSAADVAAFVFVEFSGWIKLQPDEGLTHLLAWRDAVAARPSATA
ncbi:MAG: glutathione S-transferase [Alphaproteobacteria bacterium]|nr:glutathione S-transferase [Alphaproteobacteria bacterium]